MTALLDLLGGAERMKTCVRDFDSWNPQANAYDRLCEMLTNQTAHLRKRPNLLDDVWASH